eukprot:3314141-Rhodomonas_salina.2
MSTAIIGFLASFLWMKSSVKQRRSYGLSLFEESGFGQEKMAGDGFVYFLHVHKAGGSFFIRLAKEEQRISPKLSMNALVWCRKLPENMCSSQDVAAGGLAPFFDWDEGRLHLSYQLSPSTSAE